MDETPTQTLEDALAEPTSASVDGQSVTSRPIQDLIAGEDKLAAKTIAAGVNANGGPRSGWNGLRPARIIPPGGS